MSKMTAEQANKWRKRRMMGKSKYVMFYGVVTWGIILAALFTGMEWITQQSFTTSWVYIRVIVFGILGFFIANFRWDARERMFQSH
ncbi:hypothetical protein [Paenibacillus foliorum]|nr:hypothetical protein [Paenibacillus foliorum]